MNTHDDSWLGRDAVIKLTLIQSSVFLGVSLCYAAIIGKAEALGLTTCDWLPSIAWGGGVFLLALPFLYLPRHLGFRNCLEEAIAARLSITDILLLNAVVSFSEELFFRGFLLRLIGVIPSAIVFGAMHYLGYESLIEVVYAFSIGLIMGYLYKFFLPNILLPISFHFLANAFSFLLTRKSLAVGTKGFETNG